MQVLFANIAKSNIQTDKICKHVMGVYCFVRDCL